MWMRRTNGAREGNSLFLRDLEVERRKAVTYLYVYGETFFVNFSYGWLGSKNGGREEGGA